MQYHNGFDAGKEDQNKLQQVQLENEQVQVQLDSRLQNVSKLVLNDAHKTFTFDMRDVQGQLENCNGTYGDSQAVARADLAHLSCVRSIDITPTATPSK
ncbi:MAG TPA: hypothetical protein VFH39_05280 [Candidatus Saccharimonadales bacterium]|nr:hypothetical protein [Candidatus Saccharimonadales bacterium]